MKLEEREWSEIEEILEFTLDGMISNRYAAHEDVYDLLKEAIITAAYAIYAEGMGLLTRKREKKKERTE